MTASQEDVLDKTAKGAPWVTGWRITTRLLGIVGTLVLPRLLLSADSA